MCLAVPGQVISIEDKKDGLQMARVSFGGVVRDICIEWLDDVKVGEYIIAHVGTALSKIDEAEARQTLEDLRRMSALASGNDEEKHL